MEEPGRRGPGGGRITAYLGLGSNLGDRVAYLQMAVEGLAAHPRVRLVALSPVYETEPVGGPPQPDYLNAVVAVDTDLDARALLELAKALEASAERTPGERWAPRTLDIDVLMVGEERVEEPDLVVPHPRIHQRAFVLAPLADVAPDLVVAPSAGWQGIRRTLLELRVPDSK
jgi:2-amino-4-hydroxy-6-hydroxymethyldihydropteridine diphosphokinase